MNNRLLSIDVDAHLEKLATRSYRSPAHFPVELVRSALKRGAEKIDIQIEKNRFEIRDDGRPLDSTQLELLKSLLDTAAADKSREQAIIDLQDSDGIGLLAIFSSSPTRIDILTSGQSKEHILAFDRGAINRFESRNLGPDKPGRHQETRIILFRKGIYMDQENQILREYCRGVAREIRIKNHLISGKSLIRNAMVSMRINPGTSGITGEVGVPIRGDVCRIWLLNQGIPLSRKIISPWKGFVFDAAMEFSGEITGKILNEILGEVTALYQYLIEKFEKFPPGQQNRIEELVFKHFAANGSRLLIDRFPVFYSLTDRFYFTLPQILQLANEQAITVIPDQQPPPGHNLAGRRVFRLNERQIDFLANQAGIPLQFLPPGASRRNIKNLIFEYRETLKTKLDRIFAGRKTPVPPDQLTAEEKKFARLMADFLNRKNPDEKVEMEFINARRLTPFLILTDESSLLKHRRKLRIHRYHPLTAKAVRAIEQDPRNIELIEPLLY
jgi:hypothetical protein